MSRPPRFMAGDDPNPPLFGVAPWTPDQARPDSSGLCKVCRCRNRPPFVCMGCHCTTPGRDARLAAERRREDLKRQRKARPVKFQPKLSAKEKAALVREYGQVASVWLGATKS